MQNANHGFEQLEEYLGGGGGLLASADSNLARITIPISLPTQTYYDV